MPGPALPHVRTIARHAVLARVAAAVPCVGGRVHSGLRSLRDFQPHDVPCALVSIAEAPVTVIVGSAPNRRIRRNLAVEVEIVMGLLEDATTEDALDAAAAEVEVALADPAFLPMTAHEWVLSTTQPGMRAGGEGAYGSINLTFVLTVASTEGRPDTHA